MVCNGKIPLPIGLPKSVNAFSQATLTMGNLARCKANLGESIDAIQLLRKARILLLP